MYALTFDTRQEASENRDALDLEFAPTVPYGIGGLYDSLIEGFRELGFTGEEISEKMGVTISQYLLATRHGIDTGWETKEYAVEALREMGETRVVWADVRLQAIVTATLDGFTREYARQASIRRRVHDAAVTAMANTVRNTTERITSGIRGAYRKARKQYSRARNWERPAGVLKRYTDDDRQVIGGSSRNMGKPSRADAHEGSTRIYVSGEDSTSGASDEEVQEAVSEAEQTSATRRAR